MPDCPEPTSYGLTKYFYPTTNTIISRIVTMLGLNVDISEILINDNQHHDVPGHWFKGPF